MIWYSLFNNCFCWSGFTEVPHSLYILYRLFNTFFFIWIKFSKSMEIKHNLAEMLFIFNQHERSHYEFQWSPSQVGNRRQCIKNTGINGRGTQQLHMETTSYRLFNGRCLYSLRHYSCSSLSLQTQCENFCLSRDRKKLFQATVKQRFEKQNHFRAVRCACETLVYPKCPCFTSVACSLYSIVSSFCTANHEMRHAKRTFCQT